jgi:hypothetical protein
MCTYYASRKSSYFCRTIVEHFFNAATCTNYAVLTTPESGGRTSPLVPVETRFEYHLLLVGLVPECRVLNQRLTSTLYTQVLTGLNNCYSSTYITEVEIPYVVQVRTMLRVLVVAAKDQRLLMIVLVVPGTHRVVEYSIHFINAVR